MGTDIALTVCGAGDDVLDAAQELVDALERRWTRFDDDSELMRMNAAAGGAVVVSHATAALVALAVDAYAWTEGRFDPTVGGALRALGYDRSFELVAAAPRVGTPTTLPPGCDAVRVDVDAGLVFLPAGVTFDVGGLAKGYAADLVAAYATAHGATGVCADLGGDIRVSGTPCEGDAWMIAIEDPTDATRELAHVALLDGAVATSSTLKRRWHDGARTAHHLVDPSTGRPADTAYVATTAVAASAAMAEVAAKVALLGDHDRATRVLTRLGAAALAIAHDGSIVTIGPMEDYLR
jgi:thiamine biosynthesis lipoprotein